MVLRWTYRLCIAYLHVAAILCQTIPDCFNGAVDGTITCKGVNLRELRNSVYGQISGLQKDTVSFRKIRTQLPLIKNLVIFAVLNMLLFAITIEYVCMYVCMYVCSIV